MVVRGVPKGLAKDGWWLDDDQRAGWRSPGILLVVVVALADVLFWHPRAGLGFVVWVIAIAGAVHVLTWANITKAILS